MRKLLLLLGLFCAGQVANAQYYNIPFLNAKQNPGGVNKDGENPYPSTANTGWTNIWNGDATATPEYLTEKSIPFAFKFNGATVTKYTPSNFGTISFDAGTPTVIPTAFSNLTLPSAEIPDNSVCVLGIKPQSVLSGTTTYQSAVMSKTYGSAGKRQHWIWFNFFSEANINSGWTYWAIVLEETTNNIYIVDMKTLCVNAGNLCTNNVKMSLGIQVNSTTAYNVVGSPNVGAQQITANDFTANDNSYYQFNVGNQPAKDLSGLKVTLSPYLVLNQAPYVCKATFFNNGTDKISSADLNYSIDGGAIETGAASSVDISTFGTQELSSPIKWTPTAVGTYTLKIWASNLNGEVDENEKNDTATLTVNVVDKIAPRKMLNEIFTSSTCAPCVPGNTNYLNVTNGQTQHSTIKYQVYFPGTGDPYCTQEVRDRVGYYMPSPSVPRMEVDGGWDGNASSFTSALYEQFSAKPAFLEITGSVNLTWKNKITADINLNPLVNFTSNDLKLFAVIVEGTTFANKKSNGEKKFENVMKKMMPSSSGMALSPMTRNTPVSKSLSNTFNGNYRLSLDGSAGQHINHATENSIETWDDLAVVVFVQDAVTKEVLQSETFPIALTSVEAIEQGINLYPNPANDMFNINVGTLASEDANVIVTNAQGQIVFNGSLVNGKAQISVANLSEGMYMVSVQSGSKNLNTKMVVRH